MAKSGGVLESYASQLSDEQIGKKFGPPNVDAISHFVFQCRMQSNFPKMSTFCKLTVFTIKFGVGNFSERS
jgi:hypothetical protein